MNDPAQMPAAHVERFSMTNTDQNSVVPKPERVVADYIAGMTDRFATKEHERLCAGGLKSAV